MAVGLIGGSILAAGVNISVLAIWQAWPDQGVPQLLLCDSRENLSLPLTQTR